MGLAASVGLEGNMEGTSRTAALGKRVLSTAILLPIFLLIVLVAPRWVYGAMIVLVAGLGQWEFTGLFERAGVRTFRLAGLVGGALVTASFAIPGAESFALTAVLLALMGASLYRAAGQRIAWEPLAVAALGVAYVNWLLGYALWLRDLEGGTAWVLLLVWVTWLGETAAYAVGSWIGRRKLAPEISPRKTVEGALAQLGVSILAALVAQAWFVPALHPWQAAIAGAVLGVIGQTGDLVESAIKRSVGAKDTAQLIPGHGGILDRIDGLLFNTPVLFYYASWTRTLHS